MVRRVILVIVALVVAGAIGWRYLPRTGPESGPPMADVTVPELSAEAKAGEAAFNDYCASCHGLNAAGQRGVAPPLVHIIYEPNHHGDQAFVRAIMLGVPAHHWQFGDMPPVEGIDAGEVRQIITYVRALQQANGTVGA